jgi:hypothetical protein
VDKRRLRHIRAAALSGRLPEGLTPEEIRAYSEDLLADFKALAALGDPADARRCLRYQLLALKRADTSAPVQRVRALIRQAEEAGLLELDEGPGA